jgi:hypothetical protein
MVEKVLSQDQKFDAADQVNKPKASVSVKATVTLTTIKSDIQAWLDKSADDMLRIHNNIDSIYAKEKDRNFATVESACRGILDDIGRLVDSIPTLGTGKIAKSTNPYVVSKPR